MSAGEASGWSRALAPAKVNPHLEVLGRRDDGYHEIETTLLALELADEIAVRPTQAAGVVLRLLGPFATPDVPSDRRNLAFAAAEACLAALREGSGRREGRGGLEIELTKNVPSEAGLGGGSSDAAAALVATERALGLELAPAEAHALLARLGSDCVFFREAAATGFALARGRGERVEALAPPKPWTIVVVTPERRAPTADVYRTLAAAPASAPRVVAPAADALSRSLPEARASLFNRLENAATTAFSEIRRWRELLDREGLPHARLAGSGSSFFGLFADRGEAEEALAKLLGAASAAGLAHRGAWITRAARAGARPAP